MLKKSFQKNKFADTKPSITFSVDVDDLSKVSVDFDSDTDPKHFGMMLAMINTGLTENNIIDHVIHHGEQSDESELALEILNEMETAKDQITSMVKDVIDANEDDKDSFVDIYPISPSWGNPEFTELFDSNVKETDTRTMIWNHLESDGDGNDELIFLE